MSRFAKNYCKCGEILVGSPTYCRHCGTKVGDLPEPEVQFEGSQGAMDLNADLSNITGAVRDFTASASKEKREGKYNQQKWGLFETNYQREKNITTEESLQEIEAYVKDGTVPSPAPKKGASNVGGADFRSNLSGTVQDHEDKKNGTKKDGLMKRLSQKLSSLSPSNKNTASATDTNASFQPTPAQQRNATLVQNEFNRKAATQNTAGEAFFQQFQSNERKKYQPQYR